MKIEHRHYKYASGTEEYGIIRTCSSGFNSFSYHREDGPAVIDSRFGEAQWWYYGIQYYKPDNMPLNLFLAYVKWELKKNGN